VLFPVLPIPAITHYGLTLGAARMANRQKYSQGTHALSHQACRDIYMETWSITLFDYPRATMSRLETVILYLGIVAPLVKRRHSKTLRTDLLCMINI